ncbi:hypothetical protein EDC30_104335 [Paucimonas lemoignei]|uniref:Uncharacterized protein n=1 Tax=Paucimonas lemoignei TaxID=29443 RepID=A0A4R3HYX8_PAULE|nr:hypothetical protein [Paucimonas lemoignei]TCS37531.1 hypothetical protein EDC30_104335 [Paucimonas lemoignei]
MRSAISTELPAQSTPSIIGQAEAYLAKLPEITGEDIKSVLADGMVLVSGLLCSDTSDTPEQENQRKLANLVLAKMQRITRETSQHARPGSYPCFTS